jgi:acetyl-CoA acetyltransferase
MKDCSYPWTWIPKAPKIEERSTGKSMGFHADIMAEINKVSRDDQDIFSLISHANATKARKNGILSEDITSVELKDGKIISKDEIIREKGSISELNELDPVFRKNGTVTAGSSSSLTDGASVVLIMSEEKAKELGFPTDIIVEAMASSASIFTLFLNLKVDPNPQLLLAPALAIPKCLKKANLKIEEIDFFEIHEGLLF